MEAEARLAARDHLGRRTGQVLDELRHELEGLRSALTVEHDARVAAERRRDELERALARHGRARATR